MFSLMFVTFIDLFVPLFSFLIIVRVVASYVARHDGRFYLGMTNLTEPLLGPVRRLVPATPGFDLAPLVALFLLQGIQLLVDGIHL
jgi:YggT family protein